MATRREDVSDAVAQETVELAPLQQIIDEYKGQRGVLIQVLQRAQETYGYLPPEVLKAISKGLGVPLSQVYGVVTFYAQFYLTRRGKHVIRTCDGTACHVRGAAKVIDAIQKELGIKAGETTPDYQFTFEVVYCLGSCGLAPVAVVNDQVVGRLVPEKMLQIIRDLREA
ncbi:MAG: NADH-quinone oxidoreductase subunit NuoE [Anaerolineae bacterium]|nr:NADH-quinone oxidoreductase subunit NuoE [Anaerolineae bacterium]